MFADGPEFEVLDTRPPRPGRTRRLLLLGLVAVVAAAVVLVQRAGGHGPARARGSSSAPAPTNQPAISDSPAAGTVGNAAVVSSQVAFARVGDTLYADDGGALVTIDLNTGTRFQWGSADPVPADQYAMLADAPHHRLWLVVANGDRTVVEFLDPSTLAVTGRHQARGAYLDAAALDGRLYLATTSGISVISPTAETTVLSRPQLGGFPLALGADPSRHRLVAEFFAGRAQRIGAWVPGQRHPSVVADSPTGKGDVVSVGGRLWLAGYGRQGVLVRLDPATLRAVRHSAVEPVIGVGAFVVDSARRHLLVRSGGGTVVGGAASDLWCIDAVSGAVTGHWGPAPGIAVLTDHGVVLLQSDNPMIRLPSGRCRG